MSNYKTIDHTADIGIEVAGQTLAELFKNAAVALFDIIVDCNDSPLIAEEISLTTDNVEELMVAWLEELLYLFETKHFILRHLSIKNIGDQYINAQAQGVPFEKDKHQIKKEIKAVTYHQLKVKKEDDRWVARVIFDI